MTDKKEEIVELLQGKWVDENETYEIEIVDEKSYFLDASGKATSVDIELKFVEPTINRWLLKLHSLMDARTTFLYDISDTEMTLYIYGSRYIVDDKENLIHPLRIFKFMRGSL